MALQDRDEGRRWTTLLPFPLWVVERHSASATRCAAAHHRGALPLPRRPLRPAFRRFQGFRQVDKTEVGDDSRASVLTRYQLS